MHTPRFRPISKLAAPIALASMIGLSGSSATAQDATPAATPVDLDAECIAPQLEDVAAASPAPPQATPEDAIDALAMGPLVVDEAIIDQVTAEVENLYVCYNTGDGESFVALFTDTGRQTAFGDVDPFELAEHISVKSSDAPASDLDVNSIIDLGNGSYAVDYQVTLGKQVIHNTDVLLAADRYLLVDYRFTEVPETDLDSTTAAVQTSVTDGEVVIEVSPNPLLNQPAVRLQIDNQGETEHHVTLLHGVWALSISELDLASLPDEITFVGETIAKPGERTDMLFEDLEEGDYVIVVETETGEIGTFDLTIDPPFDPEA